MELISINRDVKLFFTDVAIRKILDLSKSGELRLSMKRYGCSGMSYDMSVVKEIDENDLVFELNGVKFYVDSSISSFVNSCEVDYNVGLLSEGFVFNNPNEKGGCGCGKSFNF
ncbi:HesB/IscA family protein [Candidatus Gromoviella agglomerans]|uniref:HesB/IscA family protein n=1 Tax=Candidatus Gromoviella agglomerans TaxID=2806609 RepID=UPI001E448659|nr:iron-sulfur cluster assembly accessory protein [Candidatus Gromoviella agglomerans]UFX98543.1 Iron-binding protein IscA [Candidatus Gromoviella agglomerans]